MACRFGIRTYQRFPIHATVYYGRDHRLGCGVAWNLSKQGLRVQGDHRVELGMFLALTVWLPGCPKSLRIEQATVQWVREQEFGVEIVKTLPVEGARLEQLIASLLQRTVCAASEVF
jgi:hypothetical protein